VLRDAYIRRIGSTTIGIHPSNIADKMRYTNTDARYSERV